MKVRVKVLMKPGLIFAILLAVAGASTGNESPPPGEGPYLGQPRPTTAARLFAPALFDEYLATVPASPPAARRGE